MSLSDDILKQAEDYLDGKLSSDALKAFELLLNDNQELTDYVLVNKEMRVQYNDKDWSFVNEDSDVKPLENYLKSTEAKALKETIKSVNDDFVKSRSSIKKNYFSYIAIAASIVVLVGYFIFNSSPTSLEIYSEYNNWSNLPSLTSRSDSDNALLVNGEKAFLDKDFEKAENYFSTYLKDLNHPNALLYFGVSNMELGNHDKALNAFNQLIESNAIDSSKGYWYKALTYLKMDDRESVIETLNIILENGSNYNYTEAQELLEKLNH